MKRLQVQQTRERTKRNPSLNIALYVEVVTGFPFVASQSIHHLNDA